MNIFERASRADLQFETSRGTLGFNSLWDIPLTSRDTFNLDEVAKTANRQLKAFSEEESFVTSSNNSKARREAELRMEIVKHVIESRLKDKEAAEQRQANAERKRRILEILDSKQDENLKSMDEAELRAELEKL